MAKKNQKKDGAARRVKKVDPSDVTLIYECPDCEAEYRQDASEIVESGTAVCPECDSDCDLVMVEIDDG